ncbi:hypothetical protein Dimus_023198 [Dionaea muscipula]
MASGKENPMEISSKRKRVNLSDSDDDGSDDELHPASDGDRETKKRSSSQPASTPQSQPSRPRPTGKEREKSGQSEEDNSSVSLILSDPDVLSCPICFDPLTLPVFQCVNGHVACSSCCPKLENKCPSCRNKIGRNRCRAIEKVIDSVKIYCRYSDYGCKDLVSYGRIREHEKACIYPPCSCPFVDCLFRGSAPKLSRHISGKHSVSVVRFSYNRIFPVSLKWHTKSNNKGKFIVLQEESTDGVQFVVERSPVEKVYVICVEACPDKGRFSYDLIVRDGSSSWRFQSSTMILEAKKDYYEGLPLPWNFWTSDVKIELCIWSKDASPPDIGRVDCR